jgi:hypothetical protein
MRSTKTETQKTAANEPQDGFTKITGRRGACEHENDSKQARVVNNGYIFESFTG